ncbi:MAG: ribonuclease P [Microgenomates group bacterium GW2011_GWA2_39_19]|nr:MAG: ribonuclease P [Microgenomates group bacterium GW2011_GWA2_39_19]HBL52180.1 ribonuclease P protein component [Candidatus Blackburnbacteria bacterium]
MLRKENRLTKRVDFQKVLKQGKMVQGRLFSLSFLKSPEDFQPKFGIIVSNKISKRAVARNRIRRLLREAIRKSLVRAPRGSIFVLLTKKSALEAKSNQVEDDLKYMFSKCGI